MSAVNHGVKLKGTGSESKKKKKNPKEHKTREDQLGWTRLQLKSWLSTKISITIYWSV